MYEHIFGIDVRRNRGRRHEFAVKPGFADLLEDLFTFLPKEPEGEVVAEPKEHQRGGLSQCS